MNTANCIFGCKSTQTVKITDNLPADISAIQIKQKLHYIAPEIEWKDDYFICNNCSNELTVACKFKERCLQFQFKTFTPKNELQDEIHVPDYKTDNYDKEIACNICNVQFSHEKELLQHEEKYHNSSFKRKKRCMKCHRRFSLKSSLEAHELKCNGIKRQGRGKGKFQCDKCGKYYTTIKILKAHHSRCNQEVINVNDFLIKKNEEDVKYESNNEMNLIEKLPEDVKTNNLKIYVCPICNETMTVLKQLMVHCTEMHSMDQKEVKPYQCDICRTRFRSSTTLKSHQLYHERNRTNICSICGKCFITKQDLLSHERIHDNIRSFKCDLCGKSFRTRNTLGGHKLIVHTDKSLWKYSCSVCGKRFPQKSGYDQHTRRHLGEKNFICKICGKGFTSKGELKDHENGHSNIKSFKCDECGKDYRKGFTYRVHLAKVHGIGNAKIKILEKNYACHICPSKFAEKRKLMRHLCVHSGVKPFSCTICERRFSDKSYLKHHLKTVHNVKSIDQ